MSYIDQTCVLAPQPACGKPAESETQDSKTVSTRLVTGGRVLAGADVLAIAAGLSLTLEARRSSANDVEVLR